MAGLFLKNPLHGSSFSNSGRIPALSSSITASGTVPGGPGLPSNPGAPTGPCGPTGPTGLCGRLVQLVPVGLYIQVALALNLFRSSLLFPVARLVQLVLMGQLVQLVLVG